MGDSNNLRLYVALGVIGLLGIITFAIAAATLGAVDKRFNDLNKQIETLNHKLPTIMTTPVAPTATAGNSTTSVASSTTTVAIGTTSTASPATTATAATTTTVAPAVI